MLPDPFLTPFPLLPKSPMQSLYHVYIVTCQVHPVLVKRVQCKVRSSFFKFLGSIRANRLLLKKDDTNTGHILLRQGEPGMPQYISRYSGHCNHKSYIGKS